jgi:hypothetical protein
MAALDLDSKTSLVSDCEPSHIVNLRGSLKPISSVKWKKDSWMSHLYGTILKPSHTNRFTDWWTSSLRDTLASRSLPQAKEQEKKTLATSGLGSQMEFDFFAPASASLRMSKDTSALDSEKSLESWNKLVIQRRGEYSARRSMRERLTSGSGSSSWPTIRASEYKGESGAGRQERKGNPADTLPNAVAQWPTPAVMDTTGGSYKTEWKDGRAVSYHNHTQENPVAYGAKLSDAVKHGLPAPANHNTDGSRQGLSVDWRTPQANEAGARVETLYTKDGQPARPGERAYRKTPDGRMVLQSQTINQQVEMVQNLATPRAGKTTDENPETWAARQAKGDVATMPLTAQVKSWGTPTARDHKSGRGNEEREYKELTPMVERTQSGKLNPRWVETLMGLPVGWVMPSCASPVIIAPTNCDCSETESCQQPQNEHSELFGRNSND